MQQETFKGWKTELKTSLHIGKQSIIPQTRHQQSVSLGENTIFLFNIFLLGIYIYKEMERIVESDKETNPGIFTHLCHHKNSFA